MISLGRDLLVEIDYTASAMICQGMARGLKTPLSLVVLGLLAEQPLHPYAMRTLMRERGHERTVRATGGSLYDTVARLERSGLVEVQSSSRQGRRPERTTYRITLDGQRELHGWVRAGLAELDTPESLQAAIAFMFVLPKEEAIALLEQRAAALSALIERAESALADAAQTVPEIFLSEERYAQHMRAAERDWIAEFARQLRTGKLRWPRRSSSQTGRGPVSAAGA
jgi:DNA-binding PadR family transcriptional regulator